MIPSLVVAGTASGVGKTLCAAGLIGALRRRGLVVQPFKCGPDYIDPGWHGYAAGRPCRNLDIWMLGERAMRESFARGCEGADVAVIEGVMGLFDGARFDSCAHSTADIAAKLGVPVLLVVDIAAAGRSAAATALGFARFDPALPVAAVALNRAGSEGHARGCAEAIAEVSGLQTLGWLASSPALALPERHLGLQLAAETDRRDAVLSAAADAVAERFDLDAVLRLAGSARPVEGVERRERTPPPADAPVLAIARDAAFSFYYEDDLDLLVAEGVRLAPFSPVAGDPVPEGASGVYLGGGYPELYASQLAANAGLWRGVRALHARGAPILAECGGFMALTEALIDGAGVRHTMAGLVPGVARMTPNLAALGYREATAVCDSPLAPAGATLRGHEFHFSVWDIAEPPSPAWRVEGPYMPEPAAMGHAERGLLASYLHIPLAQRPALARRLAAALSAACGAG
ncbi:cobyrinate a,c-diamide synthase [Roseiarcus sp.]|uniref:cobyrinate a,c-diamide synthase n=1 Tax=Roseiarcus sp. TaxID=1969460 RepID=UPI003F9DE312